jgi:hypothetical protein
MYLIFSYNQQDCVCLVALYPYGPTVQGQQTSLMSKQTWISAKKAFCGMLSHSFSSNVLLLQSGSWSEKQATLSSLSFSSAYLSPSN